MYEQVEKPKGNKSQSVSNTVSQKKIGSVSTFQFADNRLEAIAQKKLKEMANNSFQAMRMTAFQEMAHNHSTQQEAIQKKENNVGLPDDLKTGMESLSGVTQLNGDEDGEALKPAPSLLDATGASLGIAGIKAYFGWTRTLIEQRPKPLMKFGGGIVAQGLGNTFSTAYSMASLADSAKGFIKADTALKAVKTAPLLLGAGLLAKKFYDSRQEYHKDD